MVTTMVVSFRLQYEGFSVVLNERKIIVESGFLGSGKTTFLLKKAREITATGTKCAVIVNEASELGVDNIEYSAMGLKVAEIFGGCICCSLALDLKNTLRILDEGYKIETVLVEPSGVADYKFLKAWASPNDSSQTYCCWIVQGLKCLWKFLSPLPCRRSMRRMKLFCQNRISQPLSK